MVLSGRGGGSGGSLRIASGTIPGYTTPVQINVGFRPKMLFMGDYTASLKEGLYNKTALTLIEPESGDTIQVTYNLDVVTSATITATFTETGVTFTSSMNNGQVLKQSLVGTTWVAIG